MSAGGLHITRTPGQGIVVDTGDHIIRLEVVSVNGKHVKIRVAAPPSVRVDRDEVYHSKEGRVDDRTNEE